MRPRHRGNLVAGLALVLLGLFFLALQLWPNARQFLRLEIMWPLIIVGVGLFFFLGIVVWGRSAGGLAVPGAIVTGIGLLLFYQNWSHNWESWAYAWTLIPGLVGLGAVLAGLIQSKSLRRAVNAGGGLILISLVLFAIFGLLLGSDRLAQWGVPALLIVGGLWLLGRALLRGRA